MDFLDLFIGSEGHAGLVITQAVVRVLPFPKSCFTGVVFFQLGMRMRCDAVDWRPVG